MKKVAIIGLGSFGVNLAKYLSNKKDIEIMAIDTNVVRINEIKDMVTQPITTDATIKENLLSIGIKEMDYIVVCSGPGLEPSIISVHILSEMGVKKIIAKALSEDHEKILRLVGASEIVSPEKDVAQKLANQINAPNLIDYIPLQSGFVMQEIAAPDNFSGKSLAEIALRKKYKVTVLAIKSIIPDVNIINPGGDIVIKESDILFVFGAEKDIDNLHKKTKID